MISIRKLGSNGLDTPGSFSIGFSDGPIPPSRLAPWQVAQFWEKSAWPLVGSPGSVVVPLAVDAGDGDVSARVDSAVRIRKAGIPTTTRSPLVTRIEAKSYLPYFTRVRAGIPRKLVGCNGYGFLLVGLPFRLLLRLETLA